MFQRPSYASGELVHLGDLVDVGAGSGPRMRVVVIIPTSDVAEGFDASQWKYLERGVLLQDLKVFGLLHLEELNEECLHVQAV